MKKFGCLMPCVGVVMLLSGCVHNLQRPFVEASKAFYEAVEADVEAGLYKPDKHSKATLDAYKQALKDADKVLESDQ